MISPTSCSTHLQAIYPARYTLLRRSDNTFYNDLFRITTANLGMFPPAIHALQQVGHFMSGLFNNKQQESLLPPSAGRVAPIAIKLAKDGVPIICCQEVFDTQAATDLAQRLSNCGYTVLYNVGDQGSYVNSGLLFATRYSIKKDEVRFWKFTNLTQTDALSSKGVLRVPLNVQLADHTKLNVTIYITHLQAQPNERKVRSEQLNDILSIMKADQKAHPDQRTFLAGDLNISDWECKKQWQGEYTENSHFFSQFYDFVDSVYGRDGNRKDNPTTFSLLNDDVNDGAFNYEPCGTSYQMDAFGQGLVEEGCLYDRILLLRNDYTDVLYEVDIRRIMDHRLSDHLPVTLFFQFVSS